ncbi:MAG TPA: metal-dependent hydrolase [Anaerolineae bacterium]|nr:metal-dependent hydrolase [Anaerolineae bacterium]HQI83150.1 metal-dependent hydrolase [Anaerolineae bacterium]
MNGKTHVALGLAAAVALGYDPLTAPLATTAVLVAGTLLPDLDHRNGAGALRKPLPRPLQWLACLPAAVFTHRGPLHSLLVLPPLLLIAEHLLDFAPYGRMAALGCVAHILADAITITGVPLLWPMIKKRLGLPLLRTGGRLERAIIPALIGLAVWKM